MTNANLTVSYSLSNSSFDGSESSSNLNEKESEESKRSGGRDDDLFGKPQDFADKRLSDKDRNNEKNCCKRR